MDGGHRRGERFDLRETHRRVCSDARELAGEGYQREMFADRKAARLDAERVSLITDFVRDLMQQFNIPGVGLSLIEGGKVVFEGGFGVKALGKPEPVDADTLFLAASNTKALALLVDERRLRWDQPVTEVYPASRWATPRPRDRSS
jgi:CubicO group peptidase (beta-lactamase class C family)